MKTKSFLLFTVFIFCISCGVTDRLEIPLTEKEITFFNQLNNNPLAIDSVKRGIAINRLMWHKASENADIEIYSYSTEDSLTVKEWDLLSNKIANFYSMQEIERIRFTDCFIIYHRYEKQNGKDYFYSYDIENNSPVLKSKSYELEEEEKQQVPSIEDTAE